MKKATIQICMNQPTKTIRVKRTKLEGKRKREKYTGINNKSK